MHREDRSVHPLTPDHTPIAYLIEPSTAVQSEVGGALADCGFDVHVADFGVPDVTRATLVVVEADRGARTIAMMRRVRAIRPDLPAVGVLRWWNEDERDLLRLADFVLHVPLRQDQLAGFRQFVQGITAHRTLTLAP